MTMSSSPLGRLYESLKAGTISRREFIERGGALGIGAGAAVFLANSAMVAASGGTSRNGFAFYQGQDGTPAASPSGAQPTMPDAGMEGKTRGQDGELRIILWQAPTMAAIHSAVGTKDFLAGQLVSEPLMLYLADGTIAPLLAAEVPAVENGGLSEDLKTITFKLREGVTWSDGEPFTAKDVVFTWQWVTNPSNASVNAQVWSVIEKIEATDDLTAVVTFSTPTAAWFEPFTGWTSGPIYPAHVFDNDINNKNDAFLTKPIGTGPYVIESFSVNDQVTYVANEKFRDPNKPAFSRVLMKGGGEAAAAARAVCQTGDFDYAWNLQVEPDVLKDIDDNGEYGEIIVEKGTSVERIHINFSDPNKEVNGQRSEKNTPHPFLSDLAVRQAMNLAVPREVIATQFYGDGQPATANILTGLESFESPNTSWEFNLEKAAKVLDDAGWVMDGNVRKKDGVELKIVYATTVNAVRQKTQAVVKQAFDSIGIATQLQQIDAGIYFDSGAGNDQNISHFYWDIDMYTNNPSSPVPISFVVSWYAGPNGENIAQKENSWQGQNYNRWVNEEYDQKFEQLQKTTDFEEASALLIELNDLIINNVVVIPEVNRSVDTYAISTRLRKENAELGPLNDLVFWNIINWNLAEGVEPIKV